MVEDGESKDISLSGASLDYLAISIESQGTILKII